MVTADSTSGTRREQLQLGAVRLQANHPIEHESELLEQADGWRIVRIDDREQAPDPERVARMIPDGDGRLPRVALRPVGGQERETDIGLRQLVALQHAADADALPAVAEFDGAEPEP